MKKNILEGINHIHFIGIGGVSMSGLAHILLSKGFIVSGSDRQQSELTSVLKAKGINIKIGQRKHNITDTIDLVVYTAAINEDNEELLAAKEKNIKTITRAVLLGQIMDFYTHSIAISGTHGKTTTTSMIAHILLEADTDPTISVGGVLAKIAGNIRVGHSKYFVTEACEYTNSFHEFYPLIGIIQNIEADHLDFFKDINDIRNSFKRFIDNIQDDGYLIINDEIPNYQELLDEDTNMKNKKIITYSTVNPQADFFANHITYDSRSKGTYDLYEKGTKVTTIELGTTGNHNISNSLAALASCRMLDIDYQHIATGLKSFTGTKRRYEEKGSLKGIRIIDDYAHHPTAIKTTIEAVRKTNPNHIWIIFQPHTYTRTYSLLNDFAKELSLADGIILTDIYAARETDTSLVHSKDLLKALQKYNQNSYYIESFDDIENFVLQKLEPNDILMTMGAGNVYLIADDLLSL